MGTSRPPGSSSRLSARQGVAYVKLPVLHANTMSGGVVFWPRSFTLVNYQVMLENPNMRSAYIITLSRTVIGTLGSVFITALVVALIVLLFLGKR